jgi:hypothetical protein
MSRALILGGSEISDSTSREFVKVEMAHLQVEDRSDGLYRR